MGGGTIFKWQAQVTSRALKYDVNNFFQYV